MAVYICLICLWVLLCLGVKLWPLPRDKGERWLLLLGMTALFLLLALKRDTVGLDTLGYRRQYVLAGLMPWQNFDYVYFEKGYLLLTKLFARARLPFRAFTGAVYGLLCLAYYRFLRRHGENVSLSVLMLICYQFLVFHISGLRQTLAMAICLLAFLTLERGEWLWALLLTLAAATCHRGALAFLLVFPVYRWKRPLRWWAYPLLALSAVLARPLLWQAAGLVFSGLSDPGPIALGGNLLFLGGLAVFLLYTRAASGEGNLFFCHMAFAAFCANLVLSGSTLLRCSLFYTLFLLPEVPNAITRYDRLTRAVLNGALGLFLIVLFYTDTLAINQLGLLPYRFFWE